MVVIAILCELMITLDIRNSGKYNKPSTQYRQHESHGIEEDTEPESISHNALKIRNALKLFTKNEHELDDLIEWLR